MFLLKKILFVVAILALATACRQKSVKNEQSSEFAALAAHASVEKNDFGSYWYAGKAELTSYHLEQARYGEIHRGHAVLIFVTEDFSLKKQVKLDQPQRASADAVKVMKLNLTKKFNTGVYPYSLMSSIFTPTDIQSYPHSLKVSTSSQEWCGHTFAQLNLTKDNYYQVMARSYFESEGDKNFKLNQAWLEDEIWNRIRINPQSLPTGVVDMIPSTMYIRLSHGTFKAEKVTASTTAKDNLMHYELQYGQSGRSLLIIFEKEFPYEIVSWEETYVDGFGAEKLTTKAIRNQSLLLDYWSKNGVEDSRYRKMLGL